jgi:3-oxoacyl-(acyl-carrier-protein) synthase
MLKFPLAITACEIITPLDAPRAAGGTWEAIRAGRRVERHNAVDDSLLEGEPWLDRSLRLGLAVARRALAGSRTDDMMLFCGTSKGPVGVMLESCARLRRGERLAAEQALQVALGAGAMGTLLGERLGLGAGVTSVAACSSGMHALHAAAQALWRGECRRALVVAADASLHPLFEASFARLGVLAPADQQGVRRCMPFAPEGRGFFLSEAGAAVVLENAKVKTQNAKPAIAHLEASWIGGDGTGLVAMDENTETLRAGLAACVPPPPSSLPPAFVHAHATGTSHDAFELAAIRAICGSGVEVFSHKGWLGHSLGAAGLASVVLSAQCHARGETLTGVAVAPGSASLTVAQGFGGHVAVARLRGNVAPA